jgi:hypothetical protein
MKKNLPMNSTFVGMNKLYRFCQHFVAAAEDHGEGLLLLWIKVGCIASFVCCSWAEYKEDSKQASREGHEGETISVFLHAPQAELQRHHHHVSLCTQTDSSVDQGSWQVSPLLD